MSLRMKQLPHSERPYEKLEMYGEKILSNSELLAIIIKTGTKEDTAVNLAQKILSLKNSNKKDLDLRFLQDISIEELQKIKGIGKVKSIQIKAVCELAKRMSRPINMETIIKTPEDVANLLMEELRYEKREIVKLLILNTKNKLKKIIDISLGNESSALIDMKNIFQEIIKIGMSKMILVHNHPSGSSIPSIEDIEITNKIEQASKIMDIQFLDHIVIGDGEYRSIFKITKAKV